MSADLQAGLVTLTNAGTDFDQRFAESHETRPFIANLMAQRVPFIVAELGVDADPFRLNDEASGPARSAAARAPRF